MTPDQENALVSGGMIDLHSHPFVYSRDLTKLAESLESVAFITDADYSVEYSTDVVFVTADVPVNITLPKARGGIHVTISKIAGGSNVTILPSGTDSIDLSTSKVLTSLAQPVRLKAIVGLGYLSV